MAQENNVSVSCGAGTCPEREGYETALRGRFFHCEAVRECSLGFNPRNGAASRMHPVGVLFPTSTLAASPLWGGVCAGDDDPGAEAARLHSLALPGHDEDFTKKPTL